MRGRYAIKRFFLMIVTFWVLITLIFFLFRAIPADPTATVIGPALQPESQMALKKMYGLDKPQLQQYFLYLKSIMRGEFGISFRTNRKVLDMLSGKLLNTLFLMALPICLAYIIGVALGTFLAWKQGTVIDKCGIAIFLAARSAPLFWTGMIVLVVFAYGLRLFPVGLMHTPGQIFHTFGNKYFSWDFVHHLVLPVFIMTLFYLATPMLVARNSILDILHEDFVEMAQAKGLSNQRIMFRYALRNALLPVVTIAPLMLGFAIGGQVLVERVFSWPGMGRELIEAVDGLDYPVIQAAFLFLGMIVVIGNFLADVLYCYIDPRVEIG